MRKIGDWTDPKKKYATGAVGFRSSGGEQMQYDNVLVYDIGDNPHKGGTAVQAQGKLAAIDVKLKGVTANIKPSSALYSVLFFIPSGEYLGCCL